LGGALQSFWFAQTTRHPVRMRQEPHHRRHRPDRDGTRFSRSLRAMYMMTNLRRSTYRRLGKSSTVPSRPNQRTRGTGLQHRHRAVDRPIPRRRDCTSDILVLDLVNDEWMCFTGRTEADTLPIEPLDWRTDRFVIRPTYALCSIVPSNGSAGRIVAVLRGIAPPECL
jgi:hypothetical protein